MLPARVCNIETDNHLIPTNENKAIDWFWISNINIVFSWILYKASKNKVEAEHGKTITILWTYGKVQMKKDIKAEPMDIFFINEGHW